MAEDYGSTSGKLFGNIPIDFIPQISKILVGFLAFLEYFYFIYPDKLFSIVTPLNGFLTLGVNIFPFLLFLILFFLIGHVLVTIFTSFLSILMWVFKRLEEKHKSISNILVFVINLIYPLNPLTIYNKTVRDDYKKEIIIKIAKRFKLDNIDAGVHLWWVAREYVLKEHKLVSIQKTEFDDNLSRGLIVNFFILSILEFIHLNFLLGLASLALTIFFIIRLRDLLETFYITILNAAYMKLTIEGKE